MGRLQLQSLLESIVGEGNKVYFQPPTGKAMTYPCIVFKRDSTKTIYADNKPYQRLKKYEVKVIDGDPDSLIPDKVADLPYCSHADFFTADKLNHDVFNLFF